MIIERISNFRMVRTVSEGEKSALLHAVSEKSGERVAVRLFRGSSATDEIEQRCQRAVQVTQLLAHPAVVRIIQAGRLPDGTVYQIQEQLSGETLASRLAARPRLPHNELLRLGRQIATVLAAAHARGVVHRALRPESLQLVPDPEAIGGERVKIADWGLAQLPAQEGQPAEAPPVPLDEPTYLSPEQCRAGAAAASNLPGPAAPADPAAVTDRIDVYALGVLLFQMAAGQPPFAGHTASEVIALHIAALPPKLEQKGVAASPELTALLTAMLIKDPTARPSMQEVEARLQQLAAQQQLAKTMLPPTLAAGAPLPAIQPNANVTVQLRVSPKSPRPRRWVWAAGLAAFVFVLAGLGLGLSSRSSPERTSGRPEPAAPRESATEPASAGADPGLAKNPGGPVPAEPPITSPASGAAAVTTTIATPAATATSAVAAAATPAAAAAATAAATPAPALTPALTDDPPRPAAAPVIAGSPAALEGIAAAPAGNAAIVAGTAPPADSSPSAAAAARAQTLLMNAQSAFDRGDYPGTIALATQALPLEPRSAALILGKTGCTLGDLALVNRSYASLRKSPAQLNLLLAECRKYAIVLGAHGQFGHKGR